MVLDLDQPCACTYAMNAKDVNKQPPPLHYKRLRLRMLSASRLNNVRDACGVKCVRRTLLPVLTPEEEAF